jgi:uncharacterized UBP type Zn finger protein
VKPPPPWLPPLAKDAATNERDPDDRRRARSMASIATDAVLGCLGFGRGERPGRSREPAGAARRATLPAEPIDFVTTCAHLDTVRVTELPEALGCAECLRAGDRWVHLRMCLNCGNVGCCDSSPNRHATAHFHETGHPLMRSAEPGEAWAWCYTDELALELVHIPAVQSGLGQ